MPLSMPASRHALRQRHANALSGLGGQFIGTHDHVRVAETPVELCVAEHVGGNRVRPLALLHPALHDGLEGVRRSDESALEVRNDRAVSEDERRRLDLRIAAGRTEAAGPHHTPDTPREPKMPAAARAARLSFCWWYARNRLVSRCVGPRSLGPRTRMPRLTLARIGFREGSNASSVIEKSVRRTGTTRLRLQTKTVSGASSGAISIVPDSESARFWRSCADVG